MVALWAADSVLDRAESAHAARPDELVLREAAAADAADVAAVKSSVAKGRLLCPYHHQRAHDPAYEQRIDPDNSVTFHRRT